MDHCPNLYLTVCAPSIPFTLLFDLLYFSILESYLLRSTLPLIHLPQYLKCRAYSHKLSCLVRKILRASHSWLQPPFSAVFVPIELMSPHALHSWGTEALCLHFFPTFSTFWHGVRYGIPHNGPYPMPSWSWRKVPTPGSPPYPSSREAEAGASFGKWSVFIAMFAVAFLAQ